MNPIWIWGLALVLYGVFSLWYNNWRGPVTPEEIETYLERAAQAPDSTPERRRIARSLVVRKFVDEGRRLGTPPEPAPADRSIVVVTTFSCCRSASPSWAVADLIFAHSSSSS